MAARCCVFALLAVMAVAPADAGPAPSLTKEQRATLRAVIAAVDVAAAQPDTPDIAWQSHLLRASDGSHYVAFSFVDPAVTPSGAPQALYVRLATRADGARAASHERSAVMEWLAGQRGDPLAMRPGAMISVPTGELPVGGPSINGRSGNVGEASTALRLMTMEREKARDREAARAKARREELERARATPQALFPFEDFEMAAVTRPAPAGGGAMLSRSLIAAPGDYDLFVAWADAATPKGAGPSVHVVKRSLHLPSAPASDLAVSSIIVADGVGLRETPYPSDQQTAHPYAIGVTDITPAPDTLFTRDERLRVAFQVINPQPSELGKPDVVVAFRIVRVVGDREQPVASLTPQLYTAATLPEDFDLRLGHPVFAAMAAPLASLTRGDYRLKIVVSDRLAGKAVQGEVDFAVVGTPASLLDEAPPLAATFHREDVLGPAAIGEIVSRLGPASPSPALARALDAAHEQRFIDLVREERVAPTEQGQRTALTALALYALGDPSSIAQFQRALQLDAPAGPVRLLLGAALALQGRDDDAIESWTAALSGGVPARIVNSLLVNAYLRQKESAKAMALAGAPSLGAEGWSRDLVAASIAAGRSADAIPLLERRLSDQPDDTDAQWLLIHALYAGIVRDMTAHTEPAPGRFAEVARAYIARQGAHASLAADWLKVIAPVTRP